MSDPAVNPDRKAPLVSRRDAMLIGLWTLIVFASFVLLLHASVLKMAFVYDGV